MALGLTQIEELARCGGTAPGALQVRRLVLDRGREQAVRPTSFAPAPRLRDAGFRLRSSRELPYQLLDEPRDWFVDVEERGTWSDLRLASTSTASAWTCCRSCAACWPIRPSAGATQASLPTPPGWCCWMRAAAPCCAGRACAADRAPAGVAVAGNRLRGRDDHLHLRCAQWLGVEALQQAPSPVWRGGERLWELAAHLCAENAAGRTVGLRRQPASLPARRPGLVCADWPRRAWRRAG